MKNNYLFKEIAEKWISHKKAKLKHSSYIKYLNLLNNYIYKEFETLHVNEYSIQRFEDGINNISTQYHLSQSTLKSIHYIIKAIIKYGSRHSYNDNFDILFETSSSAFKELSILTKENERIIIHEILTNHSINNLGILLSLTTGMRIGEICGLKRKNIHLDNKTIIICETVQRLQTNTGTILISTCPKSKNSNRLIPIPNIVMDYFVILDVLNIQDDEYVLSKKSKPYEPRTLQYAFKNLLIKCHIENTNFHALRHTFATNCVEMGFDIKTLSELLGHSNVSFTLNRYIHSSLEQKRKQMNLINNKYEMIS